MQELKSFGVGTDIEDIGRFRSLDRRKDAIFLNKIFTEKELNYSFSGAKPHQHLAARYAGKEAIVKALSSSGMHHIDYKKIEIVNDNGIPKVNLHEDDFSNLKVFISLSHSGNRALAFVVINEK
jgi:holo-[acyl-carrier protein] synthase